MASRSNHDGRRRTRDEMATTSSWRREWTVPRCPTVSLWSSRSPVSPASFLSDPLFLTCLCPGWCARPCCVEASRACARCARASCCTGDRNRVVVHPRERPGGPCPEPPLAALVGPLLQTFFWPRGTLDAHPRQANATRRPYIIYQGDPSPRWPWMTKSSSPARGRAILRARPRFGAARERVLWPD